MLRIKFCGGRQFSSPKSPTSCSCKTLAVAKDKAWQLMNESGNYIDQVVFLENIYKHQKSISQHNPDLIKSPEKQILGLADRFAIQAEAEKNDKFAKPIKKALKILFIMNVMLGITILLIEAF